MTKAVCPLWLAYSSHEDDAGRRQEDREHLHELGAGALVRYAASDADLARLLAERVWLEVGALLDAA